MDAISTPPTPRLDPSTGLTCLTCGLVFASGNIQKEHYRSEWHLYNLKRQMANLPPIKERDFAEKLQQYAQSNSAKFEGNVNGQNLFFCSTCRKKFQCEKAYQNHLFSKRHRLNTTETELENDGQVEGDMDQNKMKMERIERDEPDYDAIPLGHCLFCHQLFETQDSCTEHMSVQHGFFIPDVQYCVDLSGLIRYLGMKIGEGRVCINCGCSRFRNRDAVQKHMRDKNHCTFSIDENEGTQLEYLDFYDYGEMYEGNEDGPAEILLHDEGFFLVLPSGARIGHRSLVRYFRQSLKPITEDEHSRIAGYSKINAFKQLGWTGLSGPLSVRHAKDMAFVKRAVQKFRLKQGMTNNKIFVSKGRNDQM